MPRGPLTRLRPNHPSPYKPEGANHAFRGPPGLLRAHCVCVLGGGVSPGSASPGVGAPFAGSLKGGPHRQPGAIRGPGELDGSLRAAPTPPAPPPPGPAPSLPLTARVPAPASRGLATLTSPRGPKRHSNPGSPVRRVRPLCSLPAPDRTGPDHVQSRSRPNPQRVCPGRTAAFSPRPPTATALLARPAPLRPAPRPRSERASARTHGRRGRARCPLPVRPDAENSWSVPVGASLLARPRWRVPVMLPQGSHGAPSPAQLLNLCFLFLFIYLTEGLPEPVWHCRERRPQKRDASS